MRLLVVGAGASYAEAEQFGLPEELRPPLIKQFARRLWADYSPTYLLIAYLQEHGYSPGEDPRDLFFELEAIVDTINVERFFEFAWLNRARFPGHWENLLYHGILSPLTFLLLQGLWANGLLARLPVAQSVARRLVPGDAVMDLNYDTLFEIGAEQAGHSLAFLPNTPRSGELIVSKPHGSLNLVVREEGDSAVFTFGRLNWPGMPQPADGSRNYLGFVPPRFNKQYAQHPIAQAILAATSPLSPDVLTFWGVGLADSDHDLLELYRGWSQQAARVEVINPNAAAAARAERLLGRPVTHFGRLDLWHADRR